MIEVFQRGNADRWSRKSTIGIITTVGTYERFVPEWAEQIAHLNTQPDRIVIAAQAPEKVQAGLRGLDAEVIEGPGEFQFGTYLNHAVARCATDWIVWLGVDDLYHRHALDGLRESKADARIYGMRFGRNTWTGGQPQDCLQYNPVPCGSPFRRWIWEQQPFDPEIAPYEDWAFWIGAFYLGARFESSGEIDFTYRQHDSQLKYEEKVNAERVREWATRL